MKTTLLHLVMPALLAVLSGSAAEHLRPPAVPLVTHDPYFSIWSPADQLTGADTRHWTGKPHRLTSLVRMDGKSFRLMGKEPATVPALPQTGLEVTPTRTIYTFEGEGVRLTLTFMTPALPDDLEVLSRPVTYVTYDLRAVDGGEHELSVYFDAAADIAVNTPEQLVESGPAPRVRGLRGCWIGSKDQPVLAKKGDDLRIDWGRLYVAASAATMVSAPSASNVICRGFVGPTPTDIGAPTPSPVEARFLTAACWSRFLKVGSQPVTSWLLLAYDDEYAIKYFRQNLRPYWRRHGDDATALLQKAAADYESVKQRCEQFDTGLMADLRKVGGEKYAQLCALVYRQTLAGNKICADANGQPLMFPKENFSNGCIGTVDVLFPQAPFFLLFSPALTKAMLVPILDYAASPRWPYGYAPHDLGTYPHATGQVYGMRGGDGDRMPVEESANMLIMLAALAKQQGNAEFTKPYWPMLTRWADYLVTDGLDPTNQLCSADMFGHLPHNANLALKAILGIGGFAQLCGLAGRSDDATRYLAIARDHAAKWQERARDDGHTRLAYHLPGTWAMKHNLIWDRVLGLNLLPRTVGDAEIAWYLKVQNQYGLPVDNRTDTSLIDWALWSIALASNDADFQALLEPIWRYANETPSRVPLPDWFVTTDATRKGFQARPVVGGLFIKLLTDPILWRKWSTRGADSSGSWAPIPVGGAAREVVPTAQTSPAKWRYTLDPPPEGWFKPGFDDSTWREGLGGFGTRGTPGAIIGTEWNTKQIWLRREFTLPDAPLKNPRLRLIYDEDPEVYLNGVLATRLRGWITDYEEAEMAPAARTALQAGRNVLAVRASQTYGGQSIDVGLVEDSEPAGSTAVVPSRAPPRAGSTTTFAGTPAPDDPVNAVTPPARAAGYPSRDPGLDVRPGFQHPPPGYGEVPFWWWTGDPLEVERLTWQLDQLHRKGISGVQVNYAHEDSPGWPTYAAEPPIFSEAWWRIWGRVADECRQRGMGIGLSTYTLDWTGATNLFRQLFYSKPGLNAWRLNPPLRQRWKGGQTASIPVPPNRIGARAYRVANGRLQPGGLDLLPLARDGGIRWTAPAEGEWEVCVFTAERQPNTINPLLAGVGETVIRDFYQRFQDATPNRSPEGLNYFFNDELHVGAGRQVWNADFAAEFQKRQGYDLFEVMPALWNDLGPVTPKARMDYADVRMALMEERYFKPIYRWHVSRGLIFACDSGGRGLQPDEFGDYFRATRWYSAPGHDTPGGQADLIKGKVSSSIASLYRRPRVWLEGYHSLGWGATPERLMQATRENFLYGCTLLNLHGLYYTTHGSFWEWAPPCYHFRMPYWDHLGVFLRYFERLSYLLSQGTFVCDVAVVYPVAPFDAGLDGRKATQVAFDTARALIGAGINFEFVDADSLARATSRGGRLEVTDSSYRALIFPAMEAARWSSLETAGAFAQAGGLVLSVGTLPFASDRAGRDDPTLEALVASTFAERNRLARPDDVPPVILRAFTPDTRAEKPVRSLHRKIGPRDLYLVMDAPKHSTVEFRAKGRVELWDPWTGEVCPLRLVDETATGTRVGMPLEDYEAQIIVFSPGPPARAAESPLPNLQSEIPVAGEWEFELKPTMDNRFGDFRLPATDKIIGPEARTFRHAVESGDTAAWRGADFDDRRWERVTHGFGPQFWRLGPLPADGDVAALDRALSQLTRVNPAEPVAVGGGSYRWHPYSFSWRLGREGDPGHQGWHGLKENVTDHFLCLGQRTEALNEFKYGPEPAGSRYYLWTSATVAGETMARLLTSARGDGGKPHASEVLTPAAVFLNGRRLVDLDQAVRLRAGPNPLLVRYDRAGRGYLVLKRAGPAAGPSRRTPLAMTWFDDPAVIRFDVHAGAGPAEWFRFVAPPGFRAMTVTAEGSVEAWAEGRAMRSRGDGRFEAVAALERAGVVALRVVPVPGASGGAVLPEPIRLDCGRGIITLGDWSTVGALECYSGGAWYRKTISLTSEQARGVVTLNLGRVAATAEVRVNGQHAGIRVAPPWRVDLSKQIKSGENRIEVLVYNTLANHYLTIPTRYRGDATSGLLGPVTLELAASK